MNLEIKTTEMKLSQLKAEYAKEDERLNVYCKEYFNDAKLPEETFSKISSLEKEIRQVEKELSQLRLKNIEVGDGITINLYSDSNAYTVIKRTKSTITIQRDKVVLKPEFKPEFIEGGFSHICTNQNDQDYDYERDEDGRILTLRWSDKYNTWSTGNHGSSVSLGRHEFYDYNF